MTTPLLITLDYELFFGRQTGSVEHCMLRPITALKQIVDRYNAKLTLFVDAGYLHQLKKLGEGIDALERDYRGIRDQLASLVDAGHDVQLHIHPHWEDTRYDGNGWVIDTSRYRLHDFSPDEMDLIVREYKQSLTDIVGDRVFAYRAGGWCLQPFDKIGQALLKQGIWLDSTVYQMGYSPDDIRGFDFRHAPDQASWRFSQDPLKVDENGDFLEIPISSCRVNPLFYWKLALQKKLARGAYKSFGDGQAMVANSAYYRALLTKPSYSVASIDGAKAGLLESAYRQLRQKREGRLFNVMGHPKALTPDSLRRLEQFLQNHPELEPVSLQAFRDQQPKA
jgi:peptidoglycan/xylan/chitin deacetylase (PgdA/CDA1 family)